MHISNVRAQTDFAPGEIMFTGYDSDNPDGFSIVVLKDVTAGTIIYITDRGWSSTTGFRDDNNGVKARYHSSLLMIILAVLLLFF